MSGRAAALVWLSLVLVWRAGAVPVRVFFDQNGDGVQNPGEFGAPEILVSDGDRLFRTDADGRALCQPLEAAPPHYLFVIVPGGHRPTTPWYQPWPADSAAATEVTFGLQPAGEPPGGGGVVANGLGLTAATARERLDRFWSETAPAGRPPGFVAVVGGLTASGSAAERAAWRDAVADAPVACRAVFAAADAGPDEGARLAAGEAELGPAWSAFWSGGRCYLLLATEPEVLTGQSQARQLRWLGRLLAALPAETPAVVLAAVPPAVPELELLRARLSLEAVCYGYWSEPAVWRYDGVPLLGLGPYHLPGGGRGGFRRLRFGPEGLAAPWVPAGYHRDLRLLAPTAEVPPERIALPVRVAAFHTPAEVVEVTVRVDDGPARPLQQASQMTWRADLPAQPVSRLTVAARAADGEVWDETVTVPPAAVLPVVRPTAGPPRPPLRRAWLAPTGVPWPAVGELTAAEGRLYFGLPDVGYPSRAALVCLDATSGRTVWSHPVESAVLTAPVVVSGRVFALTAGSVVLACDAATGAPLWQRDLLPGYGGRHRWTRAGLAAWRDQVVVPQDGTALLLLRQSDGAPAGEVAVGSRSLAPPTIAGDLALLPTAGGLAAVDLASRQSRWMTRRPLAGPGRAVVSGSVAAVVDGALLAFGLATGGARGEVPLPAVAPGATAPLAMEGGWVLGGHRPGRFGPTGQPLEPLGEGPWGGPPAEAGGLLWNASPAGELSAWRLPDLGEVWRGATGLPLRSGPVIVGNAVIVADLDGNLQAWVGEES